MNLFIQGGRTRSANQNQHPNLLLERLESRLFLSAVPALDTSFNSTGVALANWAGGNYAHVSGVQVLPSGQIIAVGQGVPSGGTNQELFVARFNSNGSADNTFNTTSNTNYRFYDAFKDGSDSYANGVLLLADGSFVVDGSDGNIANDANAKGYLFKFMAAGNLDTTFGANGAYTDAVQTIADVKAQGNDLLIGGLAGASQFAVSRLTAKGTLDTTFATNGRALFDASAVTGLAPATNATSGHLSVRADGSFVYSGIVGANPRSGFAANFNAQGIQSAAFGSATGELLINYGGNDPANVTLRPDGSLQVDETQTGGTGPDFFLASISPTGVSSTPLELGSLVKAPVATTRWNFRYNIVESNGDVISVAFTAAGDTGGPFTSGGYDSSIWRANAGLTALDTNFGSGGAYSLMTAGLFARTAVLTPDGKLLIAGFENDGSSSNSIMLARFTIDSGTGAVTGTVFNDINLNGTEDAGESLANVPVYADLSNAGHYVLGDPVTTTDVFGHYSISGLMPGGYTVRPDLSLLPALLVASPSAGSVPAMASAFVTTTVAGFALHAPTAPGITAQPAGSQTITAGQGVTYTAAASGVPLPTVQWQVSINGGTTFANIPGATSTTYTESAVTSDENGNIYHAVFTNSTSSVTTNPAALAVLSPPTVSTQPANQTALDGASTSFVAAAGGNPAPTVQWQMSGDGTNFSDISGATAATYAFTAAAMLNGTSYRAVFTNSQGSATTTPATLTVHIPPAAQVQAPNIPASGGTGQTVTIVFTGAGGPINAAAIAPSNLTVTGPGGISLNVTDVITGSPNGNSITATYVIAAPNGAWTAANNGTYSVALKAGAVTDSAGVGNAAQSTSFSVSANVALTVTVTSSDILATTSSPVNLTATVSTGDAAVTDGMVTFVVDGTTVGVAAVQANGAATFAAGVLTLGLHAISATYGGDTTLPSVSSGVPLQQNVVMPLQVTPSLKGKLPAVVVTGQKAGILQTLTISNTGADPFAEPVTIETYLSTDSTVNSAAIQLSAPQRTVNLKNGRHLATRDAVTVIPTSVPEGTYHLVVALVDPDGKVSATSAATTVSVQPAKIDLSGAFLTVPATEKIGKKINATITVTNNGNVPAVGPLQIFVYASSDMTITNGVQIATVSPHINIKPGKSARIRLSIVLSATAGQFHMLAQLDPNNAFQDVNLSNNLLASAEVTVG